MFVDLKNKKIDTGFIIFLLLSFFYLIFNIIWWCINAPIIIDGISAVHFADIFENSFLHRNAPLLTWIMKCIFFLFGTEYFDLQIIFVNYVFFLISLYFIYKIGVEIKDKETGNVAMILFALVPAIYGLSRQYGHQDYQIISAITANIYCLIKTDYFKNLKWSVFYGITVGIGLLIKDEFLAYFFVPWLYIVIISFIENINVKKIINILITILIGCLISGFHYFQEWIILKLINEPFTEVAPVFSFDSIKIVTVSLWEDLLSIPIFVLFIISLIYFLFKYRNKNKYLFVFWIIVPWLIVTFMPHHKKIEYFAGFIPAIILICSVFLTQLKGNIKRYTIGVVFFICIMQYFILSYKPDMLGLEFGKFRYYNIKNEDIMYPNKHKSLIDLLNYIKSNYKNKSVFLLSFPQAVIKESTLFNALKLNNINAEIYKPYYVHKFKSLNTDIVVVIGDFSINERMKMFSMAVKQHPEIYTDEFNVNESDNLALLTKNIYENYVFENALYLNNKENKEYEVFFYRHI